MRRKPFAFFLALALLCSCAFTACNAENDSGFADAGINLEPTTELSLYVFGRSISVEYCVERFRVLYPKVKVSVETFASNVFQPNPLAVEQYVDRIITELMAGTGPDVLLLNTAHSNNFHAMAASGFLMDLNPYFEADPGFDREAYYGPVFDAGLIEGRRFFVPSVFRAFSFESSEERLQAVGIDPARITDIVSLLEETGKAIPVASENPVFEGVFPEWYFVDGVYSKGIPIEGTLSSLAVYEHLLSVAAAQLARPEAEKSVLDSGALRLFFDAFKPGYQFALTRQEPDESARSFVAAPMPVNRVLDGHYLFATSAFSAHRAFNINKIKTGVAYANSNGVGTGSYSDFSRETPKETPVSIPLTGLEGEMQAVVDEALAVNINTKNAVNAYRFIKAMLDNYPAKTYDNCDFVSKERNAKNAIIRVDEEGLNPEKDLLAYQITGAVFLNPVVADTLKETMLPFLNDEQSYENCEAHLRERLRMYWGELR